MQKFFCGLNRKSLTHTRDPFYQLRRSWLWEHVASLCVLLNLDRFALWGMYGMSVYERWWCLVGERCMRGPIRLFQLRESVDGTFPPLNHYLVPGEHLYKWRFSRWYPFRKQVKRATAFWNKQSRRSKIQKNGKESLWLLSSRCVLRGLTTHLQGWGVGEWMLFQREEEREHMQLNGVSNVCLRNGNDFRLYGAIHQPWSQGMLKSWLDLDPQSGPQWAKEWHLSMCRIYFRED